MSTNVWTLRCHTRYPSKVVKKGVTVHHNLSLSHLHYFCITALFQILLSHYSCTQFPFSYFAPSFFLIQQVPLSVISVSTGSSSGGVEFPHSKLIVEYGVPSVSKPFSLLHSLTFYVNVFKVYHLRGVNTLRPPPPQTESAPSVC